MATNLIPSPPHTTFFHSHHYTTINTPSWSLSPLFKLKPKPKLTPLSATPSSSPSIVQAEDSPPPPLVSTQAESAPDDAYVLPLRGCKSCGREEVEKGCNEEGRIQGGIATVPGFGWWPIKAYRPCPGFVESGGRYRRAGQTMDEVAWGSTEKEVSISELQSSKKKRKPKPSESK